MQQLTAKLLETLLLRQTTNPEHTARAIATLLQRQSALLMGDAIPRPDLLRLMEEMARVVDECVSDDQVKRRIGEGWLNIQRRIALEATPVPNGEDDEPDGAQVRRAPRNDVKHVPLRRKRGRSKHVARRT